ncbi:helix-turn-helix domain-containing protein [Microvirga sp. 2MCAF38]|uniref:helix-turn-helix domain-containing protein n=1 Tax=Microvirga sp. 2MCAF38 TaxID=3232989 RepID=UPI003F9BEBA8
MAASVADYPILGYSKIGFLWSAGFQTGTSALTSIHSDLYRRLIALLIQARKEAGLTQTEVARRIGQRQTFVSKYELGERRLDAAEYLEISRSIGADPYGLMREAEGSKG